MLFKFNFVVILIILNFTNSNEANKFNGTKNLVVNFGKLYQNLAQNKVNVGFLKSVLESRSKESESEYDDELCQIQTEAFINGFGSGEEWAIRSNVIL